MTNILTWIFQPGTANWVVGLAVVVGLSYFLLRLIDYVPVIGAPKENE